MRQIVVREESEPTEVVVTDIKMSFWSMVTFMVKWSIAAIPAFIILFGLSLFLWLFALMFITAIGTSLGDI